MSSKPAPSIIGKGSPELDLSPDELRAILEQALLSIGPDARVLAIIPDKTRDDNTDLLFPFAAAILAARRIAQFDALVAQGTHMPMTVEEKRSKIGLPDEAAAPGLGYIYDHQWNRPEELVNIGELSAERVTELTGGLIEEGGELIIYAPHLRAVSETHGLLIEKYGYAPLDKVREMVALSTELQANLAVAAHLAHVSYAGQPDETGRVVPRYRSTLASALDEATCRRVKLGFMDHEKFRREDYESDPDTLVVERAGRDLYLVEPR